MDQVNHEQRASLAWPILIQTAKDQDVITYGSLAEKIGIHHRAVRYVLRVIQDYCLCEHLPPLTILVVNQESDAPGHGFIAWDVADLEEGQNLVRGFNWANLPNPFDYARNNVTEDDLAEELVRSPDASADVYAKTKVRGIAQRIFRKALLRAYGKQCAFCGLTLEPALQAAHIIEWESANSDEKMAVTNGLLLCGTHHRLFDVGLMTITLSLRVAYADVENQNHIHSTSDWAASIDLHGKVAYFPEHARLRPAPKSIKHHHNRFGWGDLL